jgi:hypothetical protein
LTRAAGDETWHFCQNCPQWPVERFDEAPAALPDGVECEECKSLRERKECAFY